jgi:hypothetical protein
MTISRKQKSITSRNMSRKTSKKNMINIFQGMNSKQKKNNLFKMNNNLSAKLISMTSQTPNHVYKKSVSSTYSSIVKNGKMHQEGKQIINDSTKPFIQISELNNNKVSHFMIPRKIKSRKTKSRK